MKQNSIAVRAVISEQFLSNILAGKRRPSPEIAARLEKATGINRLAWLYPDEYPNPMISAKQEKADGQAN
jgi:transcriptional regulator with XRE-family HTH domain